MKRVNKNEVSKLLAGRKQVTTKSKAKVYIDAICQLPIGEGIIITQDDSWHFKSTPQQLLIAFFHNPQNYNLGVQIQTHRLDAKTYLFNRIK